MTTETTDEQLSTLIEDQVEDRAVITDNSFLEDVSGQFAIRRSEVQGYGIFQNDEGWYIQFHTAPPSRGIMFANHLESRETATEIVKNIFGSTIVFHTDSRNRPVQPSLPLGEYDA